MASLATRSNQALPESLLEELERRRPGLARHMTRAVVSLVHWDASTGAPPRPEAIARACEAGIDLFLATAREHRPATPREMREVAQLGILQARGSYSVEPVLAAYRIAARVAWDAILGAWRHHPDASPEAMVATANYVFAALDQVAAEVTRTYLQAREQHMLRGTRARARLLHSLVSDTFDSELAVQKQALAVNLPLASSYLALVVKTEEGAQELAGQLELPARALADATDPHTLVVLWPSEGDDVRQEVESLMGTLRARDKGRLRAGLGGEHPGLRGTSRSYLEAQQAVEVGRKLQPAALLHEYDEVAPYLILSQNPLVGERYVTHVLGPLLDADPRGVLMETLEALLTRGSVKGAAGTLNLHRHTVLYRMEKLRDLLAVDLDDPAARQRLQLALALRRLA
ncbi:MAG TPA: helix-turn-helix domain-containing protein [Candidatus Dormibacteraeota bacterium]